MTYCTQQDLIDRFGENELIQLTDETNSSVINAITVEQAIVDASAEIDGYLGAFPLPLAIVPSVLMRLACDIARFYLYDDHVPEVVEKRYDNAVSYLTKVGQGKISLGVDQSGTPPQTSDTATVQSGGRVFGRDDDGFL